MTQLISDYDQKYTDFDHSCMNRALQLAQEGWRRWDEVPVGCVIAKNDLIIAEACNLKEHTNDPTAHAEILAIKSAAEKTNNWRLVGCTLYVTVEPCAMCAGAIVQSRLSQVIYGCVEPKFGCAESLYPILKEDRHNHKPELRGGLLASESSLLLRDFFSSRRKS